ncbi:hypothetical protein [Sinorhizobium meliloti]|uniref:Uncharacterized protein n=1 Tax=Rhizobium meliloti TaxID=382 RepID=A0A2J0YWW8_RHIML|nr:hypothetical protein [Sinorhizobium meliloti]PJR12767.1 hypothetical protein CEJ86_24575 [Sinorhizobium meliloti]
MSKTSFNIDPSAFVSAAQSTAFLIYAARIRHRTRISRARGCALLKDIAVTRFEIDHLCFGRACNWRKGA